MFEDSFRYMPLILKQKPEWQKGLLNGIGGKIEEGETASQAMTREFYEEAGVSTPEDQWVLFCSMSGGNNDGSEFTLECFYTFGTLNGLHSPELEKLQIVNIEGLIGRNYKTVGNVPWLVSLALDFSKGVHPPKIVYANY